jgi:threonine/homoserine/homoserine lactone efflux protein
MNETLEILKYASLGGFLGLTAGISPGPLLTLVISETLKHGRKEGFKVAVSPLFTDVLIVLASIFIFKELSQFNPTLGFISLLGGLFIAYLGWETISTKELATGQSVSANSLRKGILANLLNPHPYIFWITVGAPLAIKAYQTSIFAIVGYFLAFYFCLTGSKIVIAHLVSKSKTFISNSVYLWIMRFLGVSLLVFSSFFILEGAKILIK